MTSKIKEEHYKVMLKDLLIEWEKGEAKLYYLPTWILQQSCYCAHALGDMIDWEDMREEHGVRLIDWLMWLIFFSFDQKCDWLMLGKVKGDTISTNVSALFSIFSFS